MYEYRRARSTAGLHKIYNIVVTRFRKEYYFPNYLQEGLKFEMFNASE